MARGMAARVLLAGLLGAVSAVATPPVAAENAMKACGARYQAAKAAGSLGKDATWKSFLASCRATMPTPAEPVSTAKVAGTPSAAQLAARERMRQCSAQWKADKAAGKAGDQKWTAYWSACSARLKAKA